MGMPSPEEAVKRLKEAKGYPALFAAAFPDEKEPISFPNVGKAIGAFERTLVTPGKFDAFLRGDERALSDEEKKGLSTFMTTGCIACHNGPLLGGNSYQKMGAVKPYDTADTGRYKITGKEEDKFVFKVPSLRNIAETGPYFHDGSAATLPDAVTIMARHQLGKELSKEDVTSIVTFLKSLTGKVPESIK
jgi:cytochrome c peroxidase